jgi:NAD(P)-dependent dehydrogenase (short-subunit alcohol dehydrogenase family)
MTPKPESSAEGYKATGKLQGKAAVISGGDSGIGRATAVAFAKEGADVAILHLPSEQTDAEETRGLIEAVGRRCLLLPGDIGDEQYVVEAVNDAARTLGRLDIVLSNAAEQHTNEDFTTLPTEQLERTFRTNVFGAVFLIREALKHIGSGGSVLVTTSITAFRGSGKLVDYSMTKGAGLALVRALHQQLIEKGVRVNGVAPGPIWTPLIPASFSEDEVKEFGASTPMKRPGQPDEVAACFVFLASDDASYIAGQVLHPNGGEIVA